eukprot:9487563-Pyramimonas_sp.AAC.1
MGTSDVVKNGTTAKTINMLKKRFAKGSGLFLPLGDVLGGLSGASYSVCEAFGDVLGAILSILERPLGVL